MKNEKYNKYLEVILNLIDGNISIAELKKEKNNLCFKSIEIAILDFLKAENYSNYLNIDYPIIVRTEEDFDAEHDRHTSLHSVNTDIVKVLNRIRSRLAVLDFKIIESNFGKWSFSAENSKYKLKLSIYAVNNELYLVTNKVVLESNKITETLLYDIIDEKIREKILESSNIPYVEIVIK